MWVLFHVPCPTPEGRTAKELYEKRIPWLTDDMRADARAHGCRFHRAWYATDGSAFYALAYWETREGAREFYTRWRIDKESGERSIYLEGDVGLVPLPDLKDT